MSTERYGKPNEKASVDPGVLVSSGWGQYGSLRLLEIAVDFGFTLTDERDQQVFEYEASRAYGLRVREEVLLEVLAEGDAAALAEEVVWLADDAEAWLNEFVAPEGYSFGWEDGEFVLWSVDTWREVAG